MSLPDQFLPKGAGVALKAEAVNNQPFVGDVVSVRTIENLVVTNPAYNASGPADLIGLGTGTPALSEISTFGLAGVNLNADNETFHSLWDIPYEADLEQEIAIRHKWLKIQDAAAATGTALLTDTYLALVDGTTALAAQTTAFDTDRAAQAVAARYVPQWTDWSTISAASVQALGLTAGEDQIAFKHLVDLTTITDCHVLVSQIAYYRRFIG
jgi:hypothetical protein